MNCYYVRLLNPNSKKEKDIMLYQMLLNKNFYGFFIVLENNFNEIFFVLKGITLAQLVSNKKELEKIFKVPIEDIEHEHSNIFFKAKNVEIVPDDDILEGEINNVSPFYCFFDKIIKLNFVYGKSKTRIVDCERNPLFFGKGWSLV